MFLNDPKIQKILQQSNFYSDKDEILTAGADILHDFNEAYRHFRQRNNIHTKSELAENYAKMQVFIEQLTLINPGLSEMINYHIYRVLESIQFDTLKRIRTLDSRKSINQITD